MCDGCAEGHGFQCASCAERHCEDGDICSCGQRMCDGCAEGHGYVYDWELES